MIKSIEESVIISEETKIEVIESREVVNLTINKNYLEENDFVITAGEAIGGHKVVYMIGDKAYLADRYNPLCFNKVIGMSAHAAVAGESVTIKKATRISLTGWGLIPDKLYFLGESGELASSAETGIFQIIGIAKDENTLLINISNPIGR